MTWGAVAVGGAVLGSGILGAKATGDAADASAAASQAGVDEQRRQFDTTLGLQAPAINTGNAARSLLASIMGLSVPGSEFTAGGTTTQPATQPVNNGRFGHGLFGAPAVTTPTTVGGTTFTSPASSPMAADESTKRLEAFPGYQFAVEQARKNTLATASALGSGGGNVLSAISDRTAQGIAMPTFDSYLNRLAALSGGAQTASNTASNAAIQTGGNIAAGLQNAGDARASGIIGQTNAQIGTIGGLMDAWGRYNQPSAATTGNAAPWANPTDTSSLPYLFGTGGP